MILSKPVPAHVIVHHFVGVSKDNMREMGVIAGKELFRIDKMGSPDIAD